MVKLEEVPDEDFVREQVGPNIDEDEWDTDDADDDVSEVSDGEYDETLSERISALRDIVPPQYRKQISHAASSGYQWASRGVSFTGSALWVLSTSALLVGVPWILAFTEEQQIQEMEREMRLQQGANEMLTGQQPAGASL